MCVLLDGDPHAYEAIFDAIALWCRPLDRRLRQANRRNSASLFNENQTLLARLGVSSPALEGLIDAANAAGALGAKLSGGGRGGNIIALVEPDRAQEVVDTLLAAGAKNVIVTRL